VAAGYAWEDERHPGDWVKVMRRFRDGHEQQRWDPTVLKERAGGCGYHRCLIGYFRAEGSTSMSTNNKLPISQVSHTLQAEMLECSSCIRLKSHARLS
jgi:hypothetical protein